MSLLLFLATMALADPLLDLNSNTPALDLDGNGRVDTWRTFDRSGRLIEVRYDHNGDEKPDEWVRQDESSRTRTRSTKANGVVDWRERESYDANGTLTSLVREVLRHEKWVVEERRTYEPSRNRVRIEKFDGNRKPAVSPAVSYDSITVN